MKEPLLREQTVHGARWDAVHEGYFSDPAVAEPLIRKVLQLGAQTRPDTIIDLGGGTGFILSRLSAAGVGPDVSLVNLDGSSEQLDVARARGFRCVLGSVDAFSRHDLGTGERSCLFVMRSVLHYFGEKGLRSTLRHLRAQAKPGEFFVHQTASFSRQQDADCLNRLYMMMRTQKWYPTVALLRKCLRAEGWKVIEVRPAMALRLKHDDLMQRYNLTLSDIRCIRDRLAQAFPAAENIFRRTPNGFCAFLHYWIYVCTPAAPDHAAGYDDEAGGSPTLPL